MVRPLRGERMRAVFVVLAVSSAVVACGPDLGTCDIDAAKEVVYLNGAPFVVGQALVYQSCAGSTCHASSAVGKGRTGAPHGLNFDVQPLTKSSTAKDLDVLRSGINEVRNEADELWSVIDSGEMPPGKAGDRPDLAWYSDAAGTTQAMLTGLDLADARDKVRNWLACQAPIVAATSDSTLATGAMRMQLGSVVMQGKPTIGPNFQSIYDNLLTTCTTCHSATGAYKNLGLDFTTKDSAYMTLVNKNAFAGSGGMCMGRTLVKPMDCQSSLLYQKLAFATGSSQLCGMSMPYGAAMVSSDVQKAVCDWIAAGAMP
jgi:hypothetical protein